MLNKPPPTKDHTKHCIQPSSIIVHFAKIPCSAGCYYSCQYAFVLMYKDIEIGYLNSVFPSDATVK